MSSELETEGIVLNVSKTSCVVAVIIGPCYKELPFTKSKFYSFGLQCDGDISNILEDGMKVQLCLQTLPDTPPEIVIAWLGDRPDVVDEEAALKPVYDQQGILKAVWLSDFIVESNCGKVVVSKAVVFRDGYRFSALTIEDEVWFDAIPLEDPHATGASYGATCAWVGRKPGVFDRFQLDEADSFELDGDGVIGTVVVVPSEVCALVDVERDEFHVVKVMVFRSSFKEKCDRIQDVVDVGDQLCMGLAQVCGIPGKKLLIARVAVKGGFDKLCHEFPSNVGSNEVGRFYESPPAVRAEEACFVKETLKENETLCEETKRAAKVEQVRETVKGSKEALHKEPATMIEEGGLGKGTVKRVKEILYEQPPLKGVISRLPNGEHAITWGDSKIFLDGGNFYEDGKRGSYARLKAYASPGKNTINFEAVSINRDDEKSSAFSHEATCAWLGKKPTLSAVAAHLPQPNFKLLNEKNQIFYGIVTKLCLPWIALVKIPGLTTTVSVHANDFITKAKRSPQWNLIARCVKVGDCVEFQVIRRVACRDFLCAYHVKLVECSEERYKEVSSGRMSRKSTTGTMTTHVY